VTSSSGVTLDDARAFLADRADVTDVALRHYESIGLAVPEFAERLRCYELNIAVSNLLWFATRGETANLEKTARRAAEL
jgi:hypothetical protein